MNKPSRIFLTLAILMAAVPAAARHTVLHEKFTNTGCGPCAEFAPADDALLDERMDHTVAICYHGTFPFARDPFYIANREAIDKRISLYGITGYPTVLLDGERVRSNVDSINRRIDALTGKDSGVGLELSSRSDGHSLHAEVRMEATSITPSASLRLFVAAVEERVITEPGPNRQTEFHHEFRGFLHSPDGHDFGGFSAGKTASFSKDWEISGFDNPDELAVVAWIQDMSTGKVIEAAYAPKNSGLKDMAKITEVESGCTAICMPALNASVSFRNTGTEPITSCNIRLAVNGFFHDIPWTGTLPYLKSQTVTLPEFSSFSLPDDIDSTEAYAVITDINGTKESSDIVPIRISAPAEAIGKMAMVIFTDDKPEEISWTLSGSDGAIIASGDGYTDKKKRVEIQLPSMSDGCYRLRFADSGGDGIGNGYFTLYHYPSADKRKMLLQQSYDSASHEVFFSLDADSSGAMTTETAGDNLSFDRQRSLLSIPFAGRLTITDTAGRTVRLADARPGTFPTGHLAKGIYAVVLDDGNGRSVSAIIAK